MTATANTDLIAGSPAVKKRVATVDILRGLVMMIMAIDHVRHFWSVTSFKPEDLAQTSGELFFTRWITHFCAPVFVFLSGISIFFVSKRLTSKQLSSYLFKRGLWLILVQIFAMSFFLQFAYNMIILEVIWVLGCSMILMALTTKLSPTLIGVLAVLIICLHDAIPFFKVENAGTFLLALLHNTPAAMPIPGLPVIIIGYSIFPWVAVMALGFFMGRLFDREAATRNRIFRNAGLVMIVFFVVLRFMNVYGDPSPWAEQERGSFYSMLSFINLSKYPPSLLFLLMTLGPAFLLLSVLDNASGRGWKIVRVYGQVPFFFYILHIPLIVFGSIVWAYFQFGVITNLGFINPDQYPAGYEPSVARTYIVWIIYLVILYFPCKWFGNQKRNHPKWWHSYI